MKVDEWIVREAIDTLRQANITLLGVTGLDSPQEFAKKCRFQGTLIQCLAFIDDAFGCKDLGCKTRIVIDIDNGKKDERNEH